MENTNKPKRTRSNYKRTERLRIALKQAHRDAMYFKWRDRTIIEARAEIFREARNSGCTRAEYDYLYGYSRALWDDMCEAMEWRLGFADVSTAYPARAFPYGDKPDGTRNLPTHGAHFWPGTNYLFGEWKAL